MSNNGATHNIITTDHDIENKSILPNDLMKEREREGRCGICGIQTHKLRFFGYHKESLTITNVVCHGRCLLCHPIEENASFSFVENHNTETSDDTIPIALAIPFEMIEHSDVEHFDVATARVFPEPSAPPEDEKEPMVYSREDQNIEYEYERESTTQFSSILPLIEDNNVGGENKNELESSHDQGWSWYIINEEDTTIDTEDVITKMDKNNRLQPKIVYVSQMVYEKITAMINHGNKSVTKSLDYAKSCNRFSSDVNYDSPSMIEIELKELVKTKL